MDGTRSTDGALCRAGRVIRALLAVVLVSPALAAAPLVKSAPPGYYHMMLGDFEVTALSDGTVEFPIEEVLKPPAPDAFKDALAKSFQSTPLETSVNAYLVNTGAKLVLIDAGAADLFGPTLGRLVPSLLAAGYRPEQVDEIYITHMHGDHIGGLVADGKRVFPNALVRADRRDAAYYLDEEKLKDKSGDDLESMQAALDCLGPYIRAGRFSTFDGATQLIPGIRSMPAYGHTPGHTIYVVESKGQTLLVWGDLMHVAAVQFGAPSVIDLYDTDAALAARERQRVFAQAADQRYLVAGAHLPFPGLGHVRTEGKAFVYVPVNYSVVR